MTSQPTRWPPEGPAHHRRRGRADEDAAASLAATHAESIKAIGDLTRVLDEMIPKVIGQRTYVLDANGSTFDNYRVPFRSITVDSQSTKLLTIANSPLEGAAPGAGAGVAFVRIGGFVVVNFRGYAWSIYGGVAGELVTVAAYANPQVPHSH